MNIAIGQSSRVRKAASVVSAAILVGQPGTRSIVGRVDRLKKENQNREVSEDRPNTIWSEYYRETRWAR